MLIDTHVFLWFLLGIQKLDSMEIESIISAQQQGALYISAISIWELAMLEKHSRITLNKPLEKWIKLATEGVKIVPVDGDIALESVKLPNFEHKDPADRFIIATARILGLKLLSKDQKITDYIKQGYV